MQILRSSEPAPLREFWQIASRCIWSIGTVVCLCALGCNSSVPDSETTLIAESEQAGPEKTPTKLPAKPSRTSGTSSQDGEQKALPPSPTYDPLTDQLPLPRSKPSAPTDTPAGEPLDPQTRHLLAQMIDAYRHADSYQDETEFQIVRSSPLSLRFERPNKFDARFSNARVVSDGTQRTVYLIPLQEYVMGSAPEKVDAQDLFGDTIPPEMISPLGTVSVPLRLLTMENPWDYVLEDVVTARVADTPVEIDGRPHDVVHLDRQQHDAVLYLDRETALIRRIEVDMSPLLGGPEGSTVGGMWYVLEVKNAQVNVPRPSFSFEPPPDSKQVESFSFDRFIAPREPQAPEQGLAPQERDSSEKKPNASRRGTPYTPSTAPPGPESR